MPVPVTIIIADPDQSVRDTLRVALEQYHYQIIEADTAEIVEQLLEETTPNLIVSELLLPDVYGIDLCKSIRKESDVPILINTSVGGEMNEVLCFAAGADDFVEKPGSIHILVARIQSLLKRGKASQSGSGALAPNTHFKQANFGPWHFDVKTSLCVHSSGREETLTRNESTLLQLFLSNDMRILSRDDIAEALRLPVDDIESRAIDVQISRLRNKLRDKTHDNLIKSIRHKGYLLLVPVRLS